MSRKFVVADPVKCTGCGICELACSGFKEKTYNIRKSRIRLIKIDYNLMMALSCRLCENPPCVRACPTKALSSDESTGVIAVDEKLCNGCGWCIFACDFGAIFLNPDKKIIFTCDLCIGEEKPKCVNICPKEALDLLTPDALATKLRSASVMKLLSKNSATE